MNVQRQTDTLRIVTMNIFGHQGEWSQRREVLRKGFAGLQPDLVAFQEAIVTDEHDQVADILGDGYHVFHQSGRSTEGSGASIASRWPITHIHEQPLQVSDRLNPGHPWIGSMAIAMVNGPGSFGPLSFVHLKPSWQRGYERERELQAVMAARTIEAVTGGQAMHVIMAGDFDATPRSASIRFWSGWQSLDGTSVCYQDAWEAIHSTEPGETFTNRNLLVASGEMPLDSGRRIDYIFVRCQDHGPTLEVVACERLFPEAVNGIWASDHFGVMADVRVPVHMPHEQLAETL